MRYIFLCLTIFIINNSKLLAQSASINTALSNHIDSIMQEDQKWRLEFFKLMKKEKFEYDVATLTQNIMKVDSLNLIEAKRIIDKYGFPTFKLVGEKSSNLFGALILHFDNDIPFQEKVLELMQKEIKHNNISKENFAYLTDRILVNKEQKQLYGTQTELNEKTNLYIATPLQYPTKVDALRKELGLEPLKIYLQKLNSALKNNK